MASKEGLTIKDVDLVFIFAFDLGDKVDAKKLGEAFAKSYARVEAIWHPPEEPYPTPIAIYIAAKKLGLIDGKITLRDFTDRRLDDKLANDARVIKEINRLHELFRAMITLEDNTLDPEYLKLGRYTRFKLVEFEAEVVEPVKVEADDREIQDYVRKMVRGFRIEPYLLIQNVGIGVVTVWINLKGNFTIDDIITLEKRLRKVKLNIEDALGNRLESITLDEFVENMITTPLHEKVLEPLLKGEITTGKIRERLRDKYITRNVIVGVREFKCGDGCFTAEDVVKERHVKEIAGILTRIGGWRDYRIDAAKEDLGRNLSPLEPLAMYLTIGASLFLGSPKLSKRAEEEAAGSPLDKDTLFRFWMFNLVSPMEFLILSDKILSVYDSFFRKKRENFQERKGRGEAVNPSEYMELRSELTEALEEYRNIRAFFIADPYRSILEYGKKVYRLTEWENVLRSALDELAELAKTHYDERFAKSQLVLTVVFGIFGIFAEIEFLERLIGLERAMAVAIVTVAALILFYGWYMGRPYRKFGPLLLSVMFGIGIFAILIASFGKLIDLSWALAGAAVTAAALHHLIYRLYIGKPYRKLSIPWRYGPGRGVEKK